jgi:ComF family protein
MLGHFLDILFPPRCHICKTLAPPGADLHLCPNCTEQIEFITYPLCPQCGLPLATERGSDHRCGSCIIHPPPFSAARAATIYNGHVQEMIHRFKYQNQVHLRRPLSLLTARHLSSFITHHQPEIVIPVPLHRKRLKDRGFNQALLIAESISTICTTPLIRHNLRRIRWTEPQISLKAEERASNLRGAFALHDSSAIKGKKVLLIDDVFTTGSTVIECAKTLKQGGAKEVVVITVARAVM